MGGKEEEGSLVVGHGDGTKGFAGKTVERTEVLKDADAPEVRNSLQPRWQLLFQQIRILEEASLERLTSPGHP